MNKHVQLTLAMVLAGSVSYVVGKAVGYTIGTIAASIYEHRRSK